MQAVPMMMQYLPYIMSGATAVAGVAQAQSAAYQAAVLERNAKLTAETNNREALAAAQDMADKDLENRAAIAALMADLDASGINSNSGSMLLRTVGAQQLADRDRERLGLKKDTNIQNRLNEIAALEAEGKAVRAQGRVGMLSSLLNVGQSFLSGSSMVNDYNRNKYGLTRPSLQG